MCALLKVFIVLSEDKLPVCSVSLILQVDYLPPLTYELQNLMLIFDHTPHRQHLQQRATPSVV
jgi:hypothetical protein